jgi:UDP-2,3-diacylglucosamine hydrolase
MERPNVVSANHNNLPYRKIGIIAGRGELPRQLAQSLSQRNVAFHMLLVEDEADPADYTNLKHDIIPITKVGRYLKALAREGCDAVTLAGPVSRPNFKKIFPDKEGFKLLSKIGGAISKGDDGLMNAITSFIEEKGFKIIGPHEVSDEFLAKRGKLGSIVPNDEEMLDIEKGVSVCRQIGALDIGQAIVIRSGYVLGVEAAEGTEKLIERCREFAWEEPAGILIKLSKPGQNLQADMPAVGPDTILQMHAAGLKGLVVEAGKTLLLQIDQLKTTADEKGIFIFTVSDES